MNILWESTLNILVIKTITKQTQSSTEMFWGKSFFSGDWVFYLKKNAHESIGN